MFNFGQIAPRWQCIFCYSYGQTVSLAMKTYGLLKYSVGKN